MTEPLVRALAEALRRNVPAVNRWLVMGMDEAEVLAATLTAHPAMAPWLTVIAGPYPQPDEPWSDDPDTPLAAALETAMDETPQSAWLGYPYSVGELLAHPAVVATLAARDRETVREWLTVERLGDAFMAAIPDEEWMATYPFLAVNAEFLGRIRAALLTDSPPPAAEEES